MLENINLSSRRALWAVRVVRWLRLLLPLQYRLRKLVRGRICLVLGSAPDGIAPAQFDVLICINGSAWSAQQLGMPTPDISVVSEYSTLTDNSVRSATRDILENLSSQFVLFINCGKGLARGRPLLGDCGLKFESLQSISNIGRAVIIGDVCGAELGLGTRDDRVSNGVFAITLALWAGATEVIVAGISLSGGHSYMQQPTPRYHLKGDDAFFRLARNLPIRTTSPALSQAYGLPLSD